MEWLQTTYPQTVWERRPRAESPAPESDSDSEMVTEMAPDHDYCVVHKTGARASNLADENETLHCQIRELQQVLKLRQRFGIERLSASDEDVRFYTKFASYRSFMAFWILIEPAVIHKMVRITSTKTASGSISTVHHPTTVGNMTCIEL